jgi:hypothetical protein
VAAVVSEFTSLIESSVLAAVCGTVVIISERLAIW